MNIVNELKHFGGKVAKQDIPSHEYLIAQGWEDTGYAGRYTHDLLTKEERSVGEVVFDRTRDGFIINKGAFEWTPRDLSKAHELMEEMAFQIDRYGDLQ